MKKTLSLIVAICLLASFAAILTSCEEEHVHAFGEEWTYDENSHWHECTGEACTEISDKANHTWGESVIVTEATPDSEGVAEKKCTVCGAAKNESVAFEGISENKWDSMISDTAFENYTFTTEGKMTVSATGQQTTVSDQKSTVKIADDKIEIILYAEEASGSASDGVSMKFDGELAEAMKSQYMQIFMIVLKDYENFEYNAESNTYKIEETLTVSDDMIGVAGHGESFTTFTIPTVIEIRNAEATLSDDGKILKLVCDYSQTMDTGNGTFTTTSGITTWTFSDYGTTVIE